MGWAYGSGKEFPSDAGLRYKKLNATSGCDNKTLTGSIMTTCARLGPLLNCNTAL